MASLILCTYKIQNLRSYNSICITYRDIRTLLEHTSVKYGRANGIDRLHTHTPSI